MATLEKTIINRLDREVLSLGEFSDIIDDILGYSKIDELSDKFDKEGALEPHEIRSVANRIEFLYSIIKKIDTNFDEICANSRVTDKNKYFDRLYGFIKQLIVREISNFSRLGTNNISGEPLFKVGDTIYAGADASSRISYKNISYTSVMSIIGNMIGKKTYTELVNRDIGLDRSVSDKFRAFTPSAKIVVEPTYGHFGKLGPIERDKHGSKSRKLNVFNPSDFIKDNWYKRDELSKIDKVNWSKFPAIKTVVSNVFPNHEDYFAQWLGYILYNLKRTDVVLVSSDKNGGTGKSSLISNVVTRLLGDNVSLEQANDSINDKFNSQLEGKIFLGVNELTDSEGKKINLDKIKTLATDPTFSVNAKGEKQYTVNNIANLWITNNKSDKPIDFSVGGVDRRVVPIQTTGINLKEVVKDTEFKTTKNLFKALSTEVEAFGLELMALKVEDIEVIDTEDKKVLQENSKSPIEEVLDIVLAKDTDRMIELLEETNKVGIDDVIGFCNSKIDQNVVSNRLVCHLFRAISGSKMTDTLITRKFNSIISANNSEYGMFTKTTYKVAKKTIRGLRFSNTPKDKEPKPTLDKDSIISELEAKNRELLRKLEELEAKMASTSTENNKVNEVVNEVVNESKCEVVQNDNSALSVLGITKDEAKAIEPQTIEVKLSDVDKILLRGYKNSSDEELQSMLSPSSPYPAEDIERVIELRKRLS